MKTTITGREFVGRVTNSINQQLEFPEWVSLLFDICQANSVIHVFDNLAFEAKSYQRLSKLLGTGISDNSAKAKIETESHNAIKRFSELLESIAPFIKEKKRAELEKKFFQLTPDSFESMVDLVADFSKVKDYYLIKRDSG